MLPMVLALSMQGESPQIQIPKAIMPVVSSHRQTQNVDSVFKLLSPPQHVDNEPSFLNEAIIDTAKKQLGVRYRWGGTSRSGFDCSGFVQYVFEKNDIELPRTSREQWKVGESVSRSELDTGDLIFFKTRNSRVSHVGIYKGDDLFIHASSASGRIRINRLTGYYAQKYAGARRVLEDTDSGI